ncbi:MAG: HAMP domain-containing histidine kinase, partial [Candidatus Aureabacteria bacterium]|nr:HAMP domain-containing histidine kinase [Candidatus Auribacterota bacterium]
RTPLMIIKEALSQILEGYKGEVREEQKEYLNMAHRNTSRLQKIIEDLLSISKIETGKIKFNRYKTDLISIMRNEINNQKIKSDEKKITITENFDRDTLDIYCDGEKMQIIFTNLLGNAIKFTPIEGHIRVSMQVNDQEIRIQMDDDGPGIPPQLCDKIFERFFRISSTPLIGSPSTGLGLAIAKELVGMHHGKIWAESDGIKGSSFFFTLPRYKGKDYLKVYFNDRIHEALDRELNLSVLRIAVEFIGESIKNRVKSEFSKRIFLDLKELIINNLFELIETVMLEEQAEIYAFSFVDGDSAKILSKKTQHLLEEYVEKNKLQNQIKIRVISATLGENGNSCDELLEWIYQAKVPTSDRDSAS